jgi:hypothetical protein
MNDVTSDPVGFEDGSTVIGGDSDGLVFKPVLLRGYRIMYRIEKQLKASTKLVIMVMHRAKVVGCATFLDDGHNALPQDLQIEMPYRRQGIATAIYVFAEKVFAKPLTNLWEWGDDPEQSPEAKAFWAQPNRPFGLPGRPGS